LPSPLTIPGVQVRTQFEPAPPVPGATGILGIVGVADRGPVEPTPVGSFGEFLELFGSGSRYSMPEVRGAFTNGVFQSVIARTAPGRGQKAFIVLVDDDGEPVARLEARAEGKWAERLGVRITQVKTGTGDVKYVNLDVSQDGVPVDTIGNLVMDPFSPNYFFDRVNDESRVLVAYDPLFEKALPEAVPRTALPDTDPRAAFAVLKAGAADVVRAEAKRTGRAGNNIAVQVTEGRAGRVLTGTGDAASVEIEAREPGAAGTNIRVTVQAAAPDAINLVITPPGEAPRIVGPATSVDELATQLENDPSVSATKRGDVLPSVAGPLQLQRRIELAVFTEGRDTRRYESLRSLAEIAAIADPGVTFTTVGGATALPDADPGTPLTAGRDKGAALALPGEARTEPLIELVPAPGVSATLAVTATTGVSTLDGAPVFKLTIFADDELVETFADLTMDPDDPRYLPDVLEASSRFLRAHDLFVRSRTTSFPRTLPRSVPLAGAVSPTPDDFQDALDRLEAAEEVDLVIASVAGQLGEAEVRTVHQAVVAHCTKMADVARNRIGIGSATGSESASPTDVLDHADDVRSDHFVLVAPAGLEASVAGLLGRQDFFESPTFKTIVSPTAPPGQYTDAALGRLVNGNVCVVNERRRLGIIVIKGLLTSGRQINVQRTANKAVREVKAISDRFIGLLNNEGARNALRQQIFAMLLQMERDGALVPSVDGSDPAFKVAVYSTQNDFASGIVRVDIAVRPVRAVDFIYATILVQN
jgi:hypothetical protein